MSFKEKVYARADDRRTTDEERLQYLTLSLQFYVLLSPYLCFISFLYLDLYVLGDEAWIN